MGVKERRERERIRRSNDIIDAAESVLFEKGLHNTTMEDIAKKAELGKATLYVYYKSKDEILLAIQARALQLLAKQFRQTIAAIPEASGLEQVRAIGYAYFQFAKDFPNYYNYISLFEAVQTKVSIEQSMRNVRKVDEVFIASIRKGQADGSINADMKAEAIAKMLWGVSNGLLQMMAIKGEMLAEYYDLQEEDFVEHFFQLIENGVRPR